MKVIVKLEMELDTLNNTREIADKEGRELEGYIAMVLSDHARDYNGK